MPGGGPSTVNNRGESAAVVSETITRFAAIYTPEDAAKIQLITPSVRIDFNQVAVSSLAKRASVLAEQLPSPFEHYLGLASYIGTRRPASLTRQQAVSRTSRTAGSPEVDGYFIVLGNEVLLLSP